MPRTNRAMVRNYRDDLRLFPTWTKRAGLVGLGLLYLLMPLLVDDLWANVLALAGITAIGAISLNLLSGYTGRRSLGHAAFTGLGAFTAGYLGGGRAPSGYDLNLWIYLVVAMILGGLVGLVIGLPALRLRGNYLVIVTLGLVFLALYLWKKWTTFTGGNAGTAMPTKAVVYNIAGHKLDLLSNFNVLGKTIGPKQGLMYLAWGLVAVVALLVKNIVRTPPGRALQPGRDLDAPAPMAG